MITDIEGVRVGHWTDSAAQTGCTVILFPEGTTASGEIRGGAPATRDFALLHPSRLVDVINGNKEKLSKRFPHHRFDESDDANRDLKDV